MHFEQVEMREIKEILHISGTESNELRSLVAELSAYISSPI
jgi:hypothetical protein